MLNNQDFKMFRFERRNYLLILFLLLCFYLNFTSGALVSNHLHSILQNNHITIDRDNDDSSQQPLLHRIKRDENFINSTVSNEFNSSSDVLLDNSTLKFVNLNDSHEQLTVHWAGKNSPVIICLAKNRRISRRNQSSSVYISHNYGESFEKISVFTLKNGSSAVISTFYISPVLNSFYLFVDSTNKHIFITKDFGKNFQRVELNFIPKTFQLHHTIPNLILAQSDGGDSFDSSLYLSENFGLSWKKIQEKISYFSWSIEGVDLGPDLKTIFIQRNEPSGLSTILSSPDFFNDKKLIKVWLMDVEEFEINGKFIFATRRLKLLGTHSFSASYQLWISVDRKGFFRALIPFHQKPINYFISDVTPETIFLSVTYNDTITNLYTSDVNFETFTLSMENVLYFNSKISKSLPGINYELAKDQEFSDLHRVSGIRGTYIVSKWKNTTKKSISEIMTLMTFDMGNKWHKLKPPTIDVFGHPVGCNLSQDCSLHLAQKYLTLNSNVRPILTRESSVGFIMATGVIGTSLKGKQNVYLTIDAGSTWRQILTGNYLYAFGDFGSIIVAVEHYTRSGLTNDLFYSIDDGESFQMIQFSKEKIRVYGLLSEPGEKTTVFTVFGSREKTHEWIIIQVNFTSFFKSQCKMPHDYKEWSPHDFESGCLLGSTQIFQRRVSSHKCFNGDNFIRPTAKINCPCKHSDYECDVGFVRDKISASKCVLDDRSSISGFDPFSVPLDCRTGKMFNKTRGYRKINGDTCEGGEDDWYSPQILPCPFTSSRDSEFILFVQRQEISMISLNSEEFTKNLIVPKFFLSNAIAADFDREKNCIFWSDISFNRILRICLDGRQVQPEILVETELDSVEGIAFNQINHHLYFVNGNKSKIELIRTNINYEGRMRRTIVSKPHIEKPRGIAIDPINCYIFITDWSPTKPAIIRSELDGENVKVLFNGDIVTWPNGIAVDHRASKIFWVDAKHDYIASSDFDGKEFKYVLRGDQAPHPFALGVFKDLLYYDDWNLHKLILINKNNGTNRKVILNDVTGAMDLKIITPYLQNTTNICNQNNTCSHLCIAKPMNGYRCLCPDWFVTKKLPDGNEVCSCPHDQELTKNGACNPISQNVTCSQNEFTCDNGNCISRYWKCDDDDDCGDNSDEKLCNDHHCKPTEFQCKSTGKCILDLWICDHEKECLDGSDEDISLCSFYYPPCNTTQKFQCKNFRCIDKIYVCDHIDHCRDGSDEVDCPFHSTTENTTCDVGHFKCSNGDCIQKLWQCDGHYDCPDKSDELNCTKNDCLIDEFYCPSGICIQKLWICDGDKDCIGGSDEINCTKNNNTNVPDIPPRGYYPSTDHCPESWFSCQSGKCIPFEWHCDGNKDCPEGSDELGCTEFENTEVVAPVTNNSESTKHNICGRNKFFCYKSNQCIFGSYVCDGDLDCNEGEDELNCKFNSPLKCQGTHYSCLFTIGCIPLKRVCDGTKDCVDGTDEWGCENTRVPVNSICLGFTCKSGECIQGPLRCNHKPDCFDESDEENCDQQIYVVDDLRVMYDTITLSSFKIQWKSPNDSLKFQYLPAYSLYDDDKESYNTSWQSALDYTFTHLYPGYTYKAYVYSKLIISEFYDEPIYGPNTFVKVTTEAAAPLPPTEFFAKEVGFNKVLLRWYAPPLEYSEPIKGYKIYYSPPDPPISEILDYNTYQHELFGFFQVGVNYTFWATSLTKNLESTESNKVSLVMGPAATIKDLHQKNITNSSVVLEWKAYPNRVSKWFIVYRCDEYFPGFFKNLTTYKTEALITNLSPGVNYQFKLYPIINNTIHFDGVQDNMISIRTLGPQLPLIVVETTVRGSVVSLSWMAPAQYLTHTNIDWEYAIYIGYNAHDLKLFARTKDTRIVLKNLYSCEIYLVQIRVIEPFGIGPSHNDYKIRTQFDPASPPKSLRFEAANTEMTKYRISWNLSCQSSVNDKVGYIVTVTDTVCDTEDRFRFQPNNEFYHSFDLSIHYGAIYEIKVSTDHVDARWSDKVILKPPSMPQVPKPIAYIDEKGTIFVVWKTIDTYPKDYQEHKLQYKIYINDNEDVGSGEYVLVKEPPAIYKPSIKSSLYYIGVSLVDDHGYVGPISERFTLYTTSDFSYTTSDTIVSARKEVYILILLIVTVVVVSYFVFKKVYNRSSHHPFIASSHYNSRSDSATLSSYENFTDEDLTNVYSDDEPLVLA